MEDRNLEPIAKWGIKVYDCYKECESVVSVMPGESESPTWYEMLDEFLKLLRAQGYMISDEKIEKILEATEIEPEN